MTDTSNINVVQQVTTKDVKVSKPTKKDAVEFKKDLQNRIKSAAGKTVENQEAQNVEDADDTVLDDISEDVQSMVESGNITLEQIVQVVMNKINAANSVNNESGSNELNLLDLSQDKSINFELPTNLQKIVEEIVSNPEQTLEQLAQNLNISEDELKPIANKIQQSIYSLNMEEMVKELGVKFEHSSPLKDIPVMNISNRVTMSIEEQQVPILPIQDTMNNESLKNDNGVTNEGLVPNFQQTVTVNQTTSVSTQPVVVTPQNVQTNVDQIVNSIQLFNGKGTTEGNDLVVVRLSPKELGDITIELNMKDKSISGIIHVDNPKAKEMLDNALSTVKSVLEKQNIDLGQLDVNLNNQQGQQQNQQEQLSYLKNLRNYNQSLNDLVSDEIINKQYIPNKPTNKDENKTVSSINMLL